jgi:pilus assembly protein CpaE
VGLDLVEGTSGRKPSSTVTVYTSEFRSDLLIASMRAGAREFLSGVIAPEILADALLRAAARRAESTTKRLGKMFVFRGAKGGSGTTTLATNFAIGLRQESGEPVALVDFNHQLGDITVLLGLTPRFTVCDAFRNPSRLDEDFISTLITEHRSGVSIFAAPDTFTAADPPPESTIRKVMTLVGSAFPFVVFDAGSTLGTAVDPLFQGAEKIFMVTQVDIPSLRNCQRMISYLDRFDQKRIELVLNRFEPRKLEFDDDQLTKAVGIRPKWKVPNDYTAALRACNTGTPLIAEKSPVSQVLLQMARSACGKAPAGNRKKFSLFG